MHFSVLVVVDILLLTLHVYFGKFILNVCNMGIGQIRRHIGDANLAGNN